MVSLQGEYLGQFLDGAQGVREHPEGIQPLRLGDDVMDHVHPALRTAFVAEATNGVRLRFATAATTMTVSFSLVVSDRTAFALTQGGMVSPVMDLVEGNRLVDRRILPHHRGEQQVTFERASEGSSECELWLPHNVGIVLHSIALNQPMVAAPDNRPKWVFHGSSISHDALAPGPTHTWPARVARDMGWHLTHLGFRGECHLDPFVARAISNSPADGIVLELGINVHNFQSMRERTFLSAAHGFLQTIRDGHPDIPLVVVSPVFGAEREVDTFSTTLEGERLQGDLTLPLIRDLLSEAVATRQSYGDSAISLIDGLSLLGPRDAHCFPDGLHPNQEGTGLIVERLQPRLQDVLSGIP